MRLIDADDLLCRFRNNVLIDVTPEIEKQIEQQPTAFDKEKIIEKLRKWENESVDNRDWNHGDGLIDLCEIHEHHGSRQAYKHAIEIVEKGESE